MLGNNHCRFVEDVSSGQNQISFECLIHGGRVFAAKSKIDGADWKGWDVELWSVQKIHICTPDKPTQVPRPVILCLGFTQLGDKDLGLQNILASNQLHEVPNHVRDTLRLRLLNSLFNYNVETLSISDSTVEGTDLQRHISANFATRTGVKKALAAIEKYLSNNCTGQLQLYQVVLDWVWMQESWAADAIGKRFEESFLPNVGSLLVAGGCIYLPFATWMMRKLVSCEKKMRLCDFSIKFLSLDSGSDELDECLIRRTTSILEEHVSFMKSNQDKKLDGSLLVQGMVCAVMDPFASPTSFFRSCIGKALIDRFGLPISKGHAKGLLSHVFQQAIEKNVVMIGLTKK